jgi:hypothetical protein
MADKYRNEKVDEFMDALEKNLTAMVAQEFGNLDVAGVLKKNRDNNPEMSIEQATMWAMRDMAAVVMRKTIALATCMDRLTVMAGQMADEMSADGNENCHRYRKRLKLLTNFDNMVKQLL